MASEKFVRNLQTSIVKRLKKVIAGPIEVQVHGTDQDLEKEQKGFSSMSKWLKEEPPKLYSAQEYLSVRVPVRDSNLSSFHVALPVFNLKGKSYQGIATFGARGPYSISETHVLRNIFLSGQRLFPFSLVVEKEIAPRKLAKSKRLRSRAAQAINNDRKLCRLLSGETTCSVYSGLSTNFTLMIPGQNHPMGMFSVVPYKGHSLLLAKDAGISGHDFLTTDAKVDSPVYAFEKRFKALSGVAAHIMANPKPGKNTGKFSPDKGTVVLLKRFMEEIGEASEESSEEG